MKHLLVILIALSGAILSSCNQSSTKQKSVADSSGLTVSDSITLYTEKISADSADFRLYTERAKLYLKSGQLDPAFRDVNLSLDLEKNNAETYVVLADLYFIIGQADNSTSSLKKALDIDPENISIVLKLARTFLMLRNYQDASQYINYAMSLDINNPEAYYLRGIQKLEDGDTTSALQDLNIAGNLDSTFYVAYMHKGTVLALRKDPLAIEAFESAVRSKPGDEKALYLLALSYQDNGHYDLALETYDELIRSYPDNSQVLFNMGYIYLIEKLDVDEAISLFQQAIVVAPGYYEAVYNLGRAYEEKGMYEEARSQYRQALDLKTNYPLAIEGLNRLDEIQLQNQ